jgi:hypothetical protein
MKKTTIFGISVLLLIGLIAVVGFAMPFGDIGKGRMFNHNETMPRSFDERGMFANGTAIKTAIDNADYNAYIAALDAGWNAYKATITQDKFNQMVAQHKDMQQKKADAEAQKQKIDQAINNSDYAAWKNAIANTPNGQKLTQVITQDNFAKYVEMTKAMQNGDYNSAKKLATELGLKGFGRGALMGRGFGMKRQK